MSNQIQPINTESQYFEIELSSTEFEKIAHLLPRGYFLEQAYEAARMTPQSSKKHSISELNSVSRALDHELETVSNSADPKGSTNKRTLRDHSKKKTQDHLEHKFGEYEPTTTTTKPFKPSNEGVKKCYNLLQKLKRHPNSGPFLEPVDVVGLGLSDYYTIIREPMDLSTVENKLKSEGYTSLKDYSADIRKIWTNAMKYNPKGTEVHKMASELSAFFEKNLKELGNISFNETVSDLEKKVEKLTKQINDLHNKNAKGGPPSKSNKGSGGERGLTKEEKKVLCQNIKKLPAENLRDIWKIVSDGLGQGTNNKEVLEFDIELLPVRVARELEKYVKQALSSASKSKNNNKAKPSQGIAQAIVKNHQMTGEIPPQIANPLGAYHGVPIQQSKRLPYIGEPQHNAAYYQSQANAETTPAQRQDDAESKSSESSFISDSDSDTEKNS